MLLEEKLITLRKSQGLSQEDLAYKLDVSRQSVYKWESGQATPDISKLKVLSLLYNVSIDNLLNNNEDIIYMNTPISNYGEVIVKKAVNSKSAEEQNTTLLPDEAKKRKTRKIVLSTTFIAFITSLILTIVFFFMCGSEENEKLSETYALLYFYLLVFAIILIIARAILKRTLFPGERFPKTYFKQEEQKAMRELTKNYSSVMKIQPDLLAWFFYDINTSSFGFYFDKGIQFLCPIKNYANLNVNTLNSTIEVDVKYFDQTGKLESYKISLECVRDFWFKENQTGTIEEIDLRKDYLIKQTKTIFSEIRNVLDAEKNR